MKTLLRLVRAITLGRLSATIVVVWFVALTATFLVDYKAHPKFTMQQIGIVSFKGNYVNGTAKRNHYAGWFVSFCDGWWVFNGATKPVVLDDKGQLKKIGYRLIPRCYSLSMPGWFRDEYEL